MPESYTVPSKILMDLFESRRAFLHNICRAIDAEHSFNFHDWQILFYVLENYKPDFVFELGRGEGNTTTVIQDYCLRHQDVSFLSVDLYNTWGQEVVKRLPEGLPDEFFHHDFRHQNFMDFDTKEIVGGQWDRLLIFWDVNDSEVALKMSNELLPRITDRKALVCMHDVSLFSGRPKRHVWADFESLHEDLVHIGRFIEKYKWQFGVPDAEAIFGRYENAGHWLMFEPPAG